MVTESDSRHRESSISILSQDITDTGIVIIGRNEGNRLTMCMNSIPEGLRSRAIYVDSGSTDGSIENANRYGLLTHELDMSRPFTAARARNAGFATLIEKHPTLSFIHFIDGDCSFAKGWLERAVSCLKENPQTAICCGRRRERFPDASLYNWLCDIEWNTPIGSADACGGDFLVRTDVFTKVEGFNAQLIAGEEPDLCFRIRQQGYEIRRIDADMTWHDANMHSFGQWWRRNTRAGFAFAEAVYNYRKLSQAYWRRELLRILFWGMALPVSVFSLLPLWPAPLLPLLVYPLQVFRISQKTNVSSRRVQYALFMTLAKFPEAEGVLRFVFSKMRNRRQELIEYK